MPQRRDDSILTLFSVAEAPELDDIAGVWATAFRTTVTENELTLDFVREDRSTGARSSSRGWRAHTRCSATSEQRRKYPHLAALKFPRKERSE
jgi:hypothetical protein